MSSALGFASGKSTSTTTNRSITAQDSVIASEGAVIAENSILGGDGSVITITDGGAFALVDDAINVFASALDSVYGKTLSHLGMATSDALEHNRVMNQESALTAQENTNKLISTAIVAGALIAMMYLYKGNRK